MHAACRMPDSKCAGPLQVVHHLVSSQFFRAAVVTPTFIADLAAYHSAASSQSSNNPDMREFR